VQSVNLIQTFLYTVYNNMFVNRKNWGKYLVSDNLRWGCACLHCANRTS